MAVKFSNNASTTLASAINTTVTSITVTDASSFPTLGAGDYTYVTLDADTIPASREVVKVTAIAGNVLTVVRGQDGTSATAFDAGVAVELRLTAALLNDASDFDNERVDDRVNALIQAGLGITTSYDDINGELTIESDTIEELCKNGTGSTILKGTPVYQTGTSGNFMEIAPADASSAATMPAVGVLGEDLTAGSEGALILMGRISGVDTSAFSEGDIIYVASGGGYTNTRPTGQTVLVQNLGRVTKVDASNGGGVVMGSGRANDVPNLTDGNVFIGNASGTYDKRAIVAADVSDLTATATELNYTDGVTSSIQTQLDSKLPSSSYTASDVLTKIKTVDGSGSGLDADLLDGQQGSYYTDYTDTAIANLVDSAPATLDTLNELAAALGDDPNFATTVTNSIATKAPLASPTFTGTVTADGLSLGDDDKATFGNSNDLEIYHDGSNSYISDVGTGSLRILAQDFRVRTADNAGQIITGFDGGQVNLYYNSDLKLGTTSTGIDVTGTVTADSLTVGAVAYTATDGTAGQVLTTDGSGNATFADAAGGAEPTVISANTSASSGQFLVVDTAGITITLPASPSVGDYVIVKDGTGAAASSSFTVARNGSNIASSATDLTFDKNYAEITMTYVDATIGWSV
jgi:hypothetical protein